MTVGDVMKKDFRTCRFGTNLAAASAMMWENDQKVLPVLTMTGKLLGMLWDRDICIALGTRNLRASELVAGDVIQSGTATCTANDSIRHALQIMRDRKLRCLPVTSPDGTFEAIVSIDDIVLCAQRVNSRPDQAFSTRDTAAALAAVCGRQRHGVAAVLPISA